MHPVLLILLVAYSIAMALFLGLVLNDTDHAAIFSILAGGFLGLRIAIHDREHPA